MVEFTPEYQERWQKAIDTLNSGDVDGAVFLLKALYKDDVFIAATELANIYEFKKEYQEAIDWYQKGIKEYDPDSYIGLANLYVQGKGVERNLLYAKEILSSDIFNIEDNHRRCLLLGDIYTLEHDPVNAEVFYRKAYELGNLISLLRLAKQDKKNKNYIAFIWKKLKFFFKGLPVAKKNVSDSRIREFK